MADPANFLASNSVLGTLFSTENSLFINSYHKYTHLWVCIIASLLLYILKSRVWNSSPKWQSAALNRYFISYFMTVNDRLKWVIKSLCMSAVHYLQTSPINIDIIFHHLTTFHMCYLFHKFMNFQLDTESICPSVLVRFLLPGFIRQNDARHSLTNWSARLMSVSWDMRT